MPLLAVMCVTGRCGAVTRNSDDRHSRDQAGCAIKWTVAILDSPASPHDPTQPPPKRRAGQSFTRGGDCSQSIPAPRRPIHLEELSASLKRAKPESFRSLPSAKSQELRVKSFFSPSSTTLCIPDSCWRSGGSSPGLFHPGGGGISLGSPSRGSSAPRSFFRE
jgi:hypothetical protein